MDCVPHCVSRRIGDRNCVALCDTAEGWCVMFPIDEIKAKNKRRKKRQNYSQKVEQIYEEIDKLIENKQLIEFTTGMKFDDYVLKFASNAMNEDEKVFDFSKSKGFKKRTLRYLKFRLSKFNS